MPCLVGCLAVAFPRLALILVWLFGPDAYLTSPYPHWGWAVVGFFLLPTTTLAFSYGTISLAPSGEMSPFAWLLVAVAMVIDLGLHGGGSRTVVHERRRRRDDGLDDDAWE